jgi:hypothetical protein
MSLDFCQELFIHLENQAQLQVSLLALSKNLTQANSVSRYCTGSKESLPIPESSRVLH